jgi:NifU-like protein involved in Fe-S cluster formation
MSEAARLYTPELLALTVTLARHPLADDLPLRGSARSRSCGSTLTLGLALDDAGRIAQVGIAARACAVGQAAAAIFAGAAKGQSATDIALALSSIEQWLSHGGDLPDWPGLAMLEPARAFPGRHGAILLAWQAAQQALSPGAAHG